ncbi:MAG: DUF4924 domain-containing protein [Flavobacteriales bacterium]|nr:MAG: DUF4924 domain-containing protein [Flavobacteriales bacterium]
MLIAQEKKKTNIAEYILYMWQIEDIIRSHHFDLTQITDSVISKFNTTTEVQYDMKFWYQNLIEQMMKEGISDKGHLSFVMKHVEEINNLHNSLLTTMQDVKYQEAYLAAKDNINNFMIKSGGESKNEIHACLNGLYGYLMLKLKGVEISDPTKEAMASFSKLLAVLVECYNKLQKGELTFPKEKSN